MRGQQAVGSGLEREAELHHPVVAPAIGTIGEVGDARAVREAQVGPRIDKAF